MAAKKKTPVKKKEAPQVVSVTWSLDELPSSQHKTGLAGLVLMLQWLDRKPKARRRGKLRLAQLDASSATVELDLEGLSWLLDETYAARHVEVEREVAWAGVKPLRVVERKVVDKKKVDKKTGKPLVKEQRRFVYQLVQPTGAWLEEVDPVGEDGPWIKLWRDFVWGVLRAVPATRDAYNARAEGREADDVAKLWAGLVRAEPRSVELPSTYFVGAQASTAENVSFRDRERFQFLLHFWPFAVGLAVPMTVDRDGKTQFVGHVLSFPEVSDLEAFCAELTDSFARRGAELLAYLPRQVVIDLPAEAGLQFLAALRTRVTASEGKKSTSDFVLGVDVIHLEREGNNVRTRSTTRVLPTEALQDEYARIKSSTRDLLFRRQLLINLLAGRRWSDGFDRLFATQPAAHFLRGRTAEGQFPSQFPADAVREFSHHTPTEASDV